MDETLQTLVDNKEALIAELKARAHVLRRELEALETLHNALLAISKTRIVISK